MRDRQTCVGCGKKSPETETNYTLISAQFGWRLARHKNADGTLVVEWRCPTCWRDYKRTRSSASDSVAPPPMSDRPRTTSVLLGTPRAMTLPIDPSRGARITPPPPSVGRPPGASSKPPPLPPMRAPAASRPSVPPPSDAQTRTQTSVSAPPSVPPPPRQGRGSR